MKKRLYLVGNIFTQNHAFRDYIIRFIQADGALSSIEYFLEADRNFFAELENRLAYNDKIYVISNKNSFTLIGKLLCTILDDKLVLKEQMLIPSQCEDFTKDSYLLMVKNATVNIIQVQESQALPQKLLLDSTTKQKLHFFDTEVKEVIELLKPLAKQYDVELAFSQIVDKWVEVEIRCNTYGSIDKFVEIAKQRHPSHIIVSKDLVRHIINALIKTDQKITLAESCTGGLLAYYFTTHAGVSSVFEGSVVTYSNILKENWLAVENTTLVDNGAVSEAVVSEMCEGALSISKADYALAVSGVAGPDGGSDEKPVGTVVIGVRSEKYEKIVTCHFNGDRNYIQQQSALTALKMLVLVDKKVFFNK
ncbi:MAG: CinA family protein [Helicobacteraceae bacterium]|nr:CinA family protein [Helicobacteraceae bacterium]